MTERAKQKAGSDPGLFFFRHCERLQAVKPVELEHDPEKWAPVFRKDHAQTKR
jgi:hypothetical protein